jgi:hypothetical protein
MRVDQTITLPANTDWRDAFDMLVQRADELLNKEEFQSPLSTRLVDGHGNLFLTVEFKWEPGQEVSRSESHFHSIPVTNGLFFVAEDPSGKRIVLKLNFEGDGVN